jgi:hypothetical protein
VVKLSILLKSQDVKQIRTNLWVSRSQGQIAFCHIPLGGDRVSLKARRKTDLEGPPE